MSMGKKAYLAQSSRKTAGACDLGRLFSAFRERCGGCQSHSGTPRRSPSACCARGRGVEAIFNLFIFEEFLLVRFVLTPSGFNCLLSH